MEDPQKQGFRDGLKLADLERIINRHCFNIIDAGMAEFKIRAKDPLDTAYETYMSLVSMYGIESEQRVQDIQRYYQEAQNKLTSLISP